MPKYKNNEPATIPNQCRATSKQSGSRCRRRASIGREVCAMHGGKSLEASPDHPKAGKNYKYTKLLPERLIKNYNDSQEDATLMSLRNEIVLTDMRIKELTGRLDSIDSPEAWKGLQRAWVDFTKAQASDDRRRETVARMEIENLLESGTGDFTVWDSIQKLSESKRKLSQAEQDRMIEMGSMLTAKQVTMLISELARLVRENTGAQEANRIRAGLALLVKNWSTEPEEVIEGQYEVMQISDGKR